MIYRLQKKEYEAYKRQRKLSSRSLGFLIFKGADGKYYRTEHTGLEGAKEITTFNRQWKQGIDNETLKL